MKENLKKRNTSMNIDSDKKPLIEAEGEELNNSKPKYNHSKSNAGPAPAAPAHYDDTDDSDYDYDEQLPYGGKVYLARRKKADTWLCIAIQVSYLSFVCPSYRVSARNELLLICRCFSSSSSSSCATTRTIISTTCT